MDTFSVTSEPAAAGMKHWFGSLAFKDGGWFFFHCEFWWMHEIHDFVK